MLRPKTKNPNTLDPNELAPRALKLAQNLSQEILSHQQIHAVMQRLADEIVHSFGYKLAVVTTFDADRNGFSIVGISPPKKILGIAKRVLGVELSDYIFPFVPQQSGLHKQLSQGKAWIGTDISALVMPTFPAAMGKVIQKAIGVKGIIDLPLMAGKQMVGTLVVAKSSKDFSDAEVRILTDAAHHAALAIRQAIIITKNRQLTERYSVLGEVDREILSQKDQSKVLRTIVKNVERVVPCDFAGIFLLHPSEQVLVPKVFSRETKFSKKLLNLKLRLGEGVIGSVALSGKAEIVNDAHLDERSWYPDNERPSVEHLLCVPLLAKGRSLGALTIARFNQNRFIEADLIIAKSLGEKSSLAIENAQLLRDEKQREEELRALQSNIITEQAELEQKLRATENRYAMFVQNTSEGIWRVEFSEPIDIHQPEDEIVRQYNERANLVEVNRATYEMYGFTGPEKLIGFRYQDVITDWAQHDERVRRFIRQGFRLSNWESVERTETGESKYFLNSYFGEVEDGKLVRMWGTQADITELKRVGWALLESEKKFRTLFERSRDAIFISTPEGKLVDINDAGVELFGFESKDEIMKVDISRDLYLNPSDRDAILKRIEEEGFVKDFELQLKKKSGEPMVVLETGVVLHNPDGTVAGYQGILRDISKQKRAQEEIQAWRQRYDLIVASSGQVVYEYDVTTGAILWSGSVKDVLGYTVQEMSGGLAQWIELINLDDKDDAVALLEQAEREMKPYEVEYRFRKKDGSYIWMHDRGFFVAGSDGKAHKMLGMMQDIDTHKKLERQVKSSEQRYRSLFEHANDAVLLMKKEVIVDCNPKALGMFGCKRDELIGQRFHTYSPPNQVTGANSKSFFEEKVQAALNGVSQQFTWRHARRDGSYFEAEVRLNKLELQGEELLQAQIRDITEQLLAQEELARSEERYRQLVREAGEAILVSDGEGNFLEVNEKACRLLGYTYQELVKMNIADIVDPPREEALAGYRRFYQRLLSEGNIVAADRFMVRRDGTRFPYEINAVLLGNGMLQAIIRDITERTRAEEELNHIYSVAATSHGRELFENAARTVAGLFKMDFVRIGEISADRTSVLAHVFYEKGEVHFGEKIPLLGTPCENILQEVKACEYEAKAYTLFPNDPQLMKWKVESYLGLPMLDSKKNVIGVIAAFDARPHEFTDHEKKILTIIAQRLSSELEMMLQREREEQLSAQLLQAQKMESLGTLAGGVAHDFNNILAAILGYATLMKRTLDPESKHYRQLEAIEKSSQRAAALSKQLLSFAQNAPAEIKALNLNDIVTETCELLQSSFPKTIVLKQELFEQLPSIEADQNQLGQVIMNLFINARDTILERKDPARSGEIKVSTLKVHAGEGFVESHLSARPGDYVCMMITDNGTGMSREIQQRIFEPFFTTKERGKGTGLGLSLVYGIVRNHNGFVDVYSEEGRGTTFKLYFPVSMSHAAAEQLETTEGKIIKGSGQTILVVDDEKVLRELVSEILFDHGYKVVSASNGKEALEVYRREWNNINLVLLDMIMPEMDGVTTYGELTQINPAVRVLISSGFSQDSSVQQLLNRGACGFVGKPYRSDDLLQIVATVLATEERASRQ